MHIAFQGVYVFDMTLLVQENEFLEPARNGETVIQTVSSVCDGANFDSSSRIVTLKLEKETPKFGLKK